MLGLRLLNGDPGARLQGPELRVELRLANGLDREGLERLIGRLGAAWSGSRLIADRVDSLTVAVLPPGPSGT
ncbi:hypothetical protein [Naasia aerilata]|uniref:Uncharacterized protein n=1 Tax=Naasia aerilata TaxID=1162966 RepID=A0ABN6XUJ4_9MICO|nr:hypothetical protein [Naasia aerilata]BDZ47567.1 hypothetical protein GCM10025866_34760 [Naasia aerilata]